MIYFLLGLVLGGAAMCLLYVRARRQIDALETANLTLARDRQVAVEFMHEMTEALAESPDRDRLYALIVHASITCTGALSACIFERTLGARMRGVAVEGLFPPHRPLPESTKGKLTTRAKFIEQVLKAETFPVGEGIVGRVAETGQGEWIADAARDPRIVRHDDPALTVRSLIVVPLTFRQRSFGVLAVANPTHGGPFTETDFQLVQSLAEQAALALHNAAFLHLQIEKRQLDVDLALASSLQHMLLPRQMPAVAGLDLEARYLPAQTVGGDLYDLIPLGGGRLGVAVADVSGKGIPASLLMAICRTHLRQIATRHLSPARVLGELGAVLHGETVREMYITMLYAVIDPAAGSVTFARAGHEQLLRGYREGSAGQFSATYVGGDGMALGMVPPDLFLESLEERTASFVPGDVLVFYTDGLTEAPNEEDTEFSGSRLADAVRTLHGRSAIEITEGILEQLRRFTGNQPLRDDLTLVTVKRV